MADAIGMVGLALLFLSPFALIAWLGRQADRP